MPVALDLFFESVRYLQDGDESKAATLYQEALKADPFLHTNACEALINMKPEIATLKMRERSITGLGSILSTWRITARRKAGMREPSMPFTRSDTQNGKAGLAATLEGSK